MATGKQLNGVDADEQRLEALLDVLTSRSGDMAVRAYDTYASAVPETAMWSEAERDRFISQSRQRFEAILSIAGQADELDEALLSELRDVGMTAAWAGNPLPPLLMVLRISRDLVVQSALAVAEEGGRRWGAPLSVLLARVLHATDRFTDALAQGYWAALVGEPEADAGIRLVHAGIRLVDGPG